MNLLYSQYKQLSQEAFFATLHHENIVFSVGVSARLVTNQRMHEINRELRGKDETTDVLSFPLMSREDILRANRQGIHVNLGDMVINLEKAQEQAHQYGHSMRREVAFLTVHATLHLLGYDHDTTEREVEMFAKQETILEGLGITR